MPMAAFFLCTFQSTHLWSPTHSLFLFFPSEKNRSPSGINGTHTKKNAITLGIKPHIKAS